MPRVLIAGCGYVGSKAAELFCTAGWDVFGVTHSEESARHLTGAPFPVVACDIADREAVAQLSTLNSPPLRHADAIVDCVSSSGRGGAEAYRRIYLEGARNLLEVLQPGTFLFTSSTSVYAQTDGSWVTEESPAEPERETGRVLRETEQLVLAHGGIIARLAGIYGPDRSALVRKFSEGTAVLEGGGSRYLNHIHRDDAASALFFLIANRLPSGIYNVTDNTPLTQRECYQSLATRLGQPLPPEGPVDPHRKRGSTHKRVSNAKLRALGWQPKVPTFTSG